MGTASLSTLGSTGVAGVGQGGGIGGGEGGNDLGGLGAYTYGDVDDDKVVSSAFHLALDDDDLPVSQ